MATEKILNTRIQLKYDSFANWSKNNPTLKSGEVAIAYLGNTVDTTEVTPNNNTHPVMFKVGPGEFNSLPWASALAADVYSWAKKSEADFTTWVKGLIKVTDIDAYSKSEVDKKLSDNSTADKKYADDLIAALDVTDTAVAGKYVSAVSETDGKISVTRADLPTYTLTTGSANGTVAFNGSDVAVKGLGSAAYTASTAYATAAQGAKADSAVQNIKVLGETLTNGGELTVAEAKSALGLGSAAYVNTTAFDPANSAATAKSEAIAAAAQDAAGKYATIKAAQDAQNSADEANRKIDAFMADDATVNDTIDTLVEINKYIADDTAAFTALSEKVTKLENGTTAAKEAEHADKADVASGLDTAGVAQVQGIKVNNATNADKANSLTDNAKAEVKAVKVDNATHADTATKATQDGSGNVITATYETKADATQKLADAKSYADGLAGNYATAAQGSKADSAVQSGSFAGTAFTKTGTALSISQADARTALGLGSAAYTASTAYATAAQGALADTALQKADIATGTANGTIAVEGTNIAVAGLKSAAYTESSAYATAAQGTKADSALQEIKTTANGGLKVTNKNQIDIDTNVVFVFNCGSSTELVD